MNTKIVLFLIVISVCFLFNCQSPSKSENVSASLIKYVDPLIGTGASTVPSALKHGSGTENLSQTFPAAGVPFGMTNWTPQTRASVAKCVSPYYYADTVFQGFRASHWMSGSCTQDYGSTTIMPISGSLKFLPEERAVSLDHTLEVSHPDYYALDLASYHLKTEMTGVSHSGIFRFNWQQQDSAFIVIQPNLRDNQEGWIEVDIKNQEIRGYSPASRIYQGWGQDAGFKGYFVVKFSEKFEHFGTWQKGKASYESISAESQESVGAFVGWALAADSEILVKMGLSFSSVEQARKNLQAEIPHWDFEAIRQQSATAWETALAKIKVKGKDENTQTTFYTALYHSMFLPREFSDVDGTYPGFAADTNFYQAEDFKYYADFSMWDTYRALHPLFTIIEPERSKDMMQSLVKKAEQGEWLPIFPSWNQYTAAMIGDHAVSTLTDAYVKGIQGFDAEKAYYYMRKNAFESPATWEEYVDGKGRRALPSYLEYGYIPLEDSVKEAFHKMEQVSRTLEYAYEDFALLQMAKALGKSEDIPILEKRAQNYRNIFDPSVGFMRGKYKDGSWYEPFDADKKRPPIYTEGTAWQYSWYVPHDVQGLIELVGGRKAFTAKMDTLFAQGHYWHGNEPSHQIAFLYNYAGQPWKTQANVRSILHEEYSTGPGGLSGNDDSGQMSAWYVFGAIGMYPVCPSIPEYALCSPIFDEVTIDTGGEKPFVIRCLNNSAENMYIQSAKLNGQPYDKAYLQHQDILAGGVLEFEMGAEINDNWASQPEAAAYSMSK